MRLSCSLTNSPPKQNVNSEIWYSITFNSLHVQCVNIQENIFYFTYFKVNVKLKLVNIEKGNLLFRHCYIEKYINIFLKLKKKRPISVWVL